MMLFASIVFYVSLFGIGALFVLKRWEERHGHVLAVDLREKADLRAHDLKELLARGRVEAEKLPPEAARLARMLVHALALEAASLARKAEVQAHRLADLVSHKHHFERREPRSEFLKKVAEHKNGDGRAEQLDTTTKGGHNA